MSVEDDGCAEWFGVALILVYGVCIAEVTRLLLIDVTTYADADDAGGASSVAVLWSERMLGPSTESNGCSAAECIDDDDAIFIFGDISSLSLPRMGVLWHLQ